MTECDEMERESSSLVSTRHGTHRPDRRPSSCSFGQIASHFAFLAISSLTLTHIYIGLTFYRINPRSRSYAGPWVAVWWPCAVMILSESRDYKYPGGLWLPWKCCLPRDVGMRLTVWVTEMILVRYDMLHLVLCISLLCAGSAHSPWDNTKSCGMFVRSGRDDHTYQSLATSCQSKHIALNPNTAVDGLQKQTNLWAHRISQRVTSSYCILFHLHGIILNASLSIIFLDLDNLVYALTISAHHNKQNWRRNWQSIYIIWRQSTGFLETLQQRH